MKILVKKKDCGHFWISRAHSETKTVIKSHLQSIVKNVNATLLRFLSHCVHAIPQNGPQFTKLSNHSRQNTSFPFFTIDDTSEEIDECGAVINSISFADSLLMCQKRINFVVSILFFTH